MPVAMSLAAKSMGYMGKEGMDTFMKLLDTGKILSTEFMIPFANALRTMVRETGALDAALSTVQKSRERMVSVFKLVTSSGFTKASGSIKEFFESLSEILLQNRKGFEALGTMIGSVFRVITFGIDLLSPALTLFLSTLSMFATLQEDAFNMDKKAKDIGRVTRLVRVLAGVVMIVAGALMQMSGALDEFILKATQGNLKDIISEYGLPVLKQAVMLSNPAAALSGFATDLFSGDTETTSALAGKLATPNVDSSSNRSTTIGQLNVSVDNPVNGTPTDVGVGVAVSLKDELTMFGAAM